MISINKMTTEDLEELKDILETDFDNFWSYNVLLSELSNSNSYYIIAKDEERILGFAGMIDTIDQFEITNIVVKKTNRNKRIGTMLLNSLIDTAKSQGKACIYLEVNEKNLPAIILYEKNGFKKCGLRKKYYNNTENAILMQLIIK